MAGCSSHIKVLTPDTFMLKHKSVYSYNASVYSYNASERFIYSSFHKIRLRLYSYDHENWKFIMSLIVIFASLLMQNWWFQCRNILLIRHWLMWFFICLWLKWFLILHWWKWFLILNWLKWFLIQHKNTVIFIIYINQNNIFFLIKKQLYLYHIRNKLQQFMYNYQ